MRRSSPFRCDPFTQRGLATNRHTGQGLRWRWVFSALVALATCFAGLPRAAAAPPGPAGEDRPPNGLCLLCHSQPGLTVSTGEGQERPIAAVDPAAFGASAHGREECIDCHAGQSALPHPILASQTQPGAGRATACSECHAEANEGYLDSVHGTMAKLSDARAPACAGCHGDAHTVQPLKDWAEQERAGVCAGCHPGAGTLPRGLESRGALAGLLPSAYFAERFLVILTSLVLGFAVIHVELDLLRWLVARWAARSGEMSHGHAPEPPSAAGGGS
jgi:hypothetical protein